MPQKILDLFAPGFQLRWGRFVELVNRILVILGKAHPGAKGDNQRETEAFHDTEVYLPAR